MHNENTKETSAWLIDEEISHTVAGDNIIVGVITEPEKLKALVHKFWVIYAPESGGLIINTKKKLEK